jgi:hypothetical protein
MNVIARHFMRKMGRQPVSGQLGWDAGDLRGERALWSLSSYRK